MIQALLPALLTAGSAATSAISGNKAAKQQAAQTKTAAADINRNYDRTRGDLSGFIGMGQAAQSPLAILMGLNPADTPMGREAASAPDYRAFLEQNPDVLAEFSRQMNLKGGKGAELLAREGVRSPEEFVKYVRDRGHYTDRALPTMGGAAGAGGTASAPAGATAITPSEYLMSLPGVQAMLKAGTDAVTQSAYAKGKSGGGVLKDISDRAQQTMYGVYDAETSRLMNLMSGGANTATSLGSIGANATGQAANLMANTPVPGQSPWANAFGAAAGFFSGEGGSDLISGIGEWWKNRNKTTTHHALPVGAYS